MWCRFGVTVFVSAAVTALALAPLRVGGAREHRDGDTKSARAYLLRAEEEHAVEESVAEESAGRFEGGSGVRAKGEEGAMGAPYQWGSRDGSGAGIARGAASREAAEFGMIGLLNTGAGAAPGPSAPADGNPALRGRPLDRESAENFRDSGINPPTDPAEDASSTFAIDVDTASYAIVRRKLVTGHKPPAAAVRAEELINYFDYGYGGPSDDEPLTADLHAAPSPYEAGHLLVRVALQAQGRDGARKPAHLVYLVDTSGSMQSADKIGLAKTSLRLLTGALRAGDTVALCTYAGSVREVLPPTGIERRADILRAIDELDAEGSTAMASGIELAYRLAEKTFHAGDIHRVVVLSDGDANVGDTDPDAILTSIAAHRKKGIFLSTVGFGDGNYNDAMMERLADAGDGNYHYIDGPNEAKRVFVAELDGMLEVVARDVKVQVAFDPALVGSYRLIGYENRDVADKDFRNDKVDGGEVGAGHSVTAMYDVVLKPYVAAVAARPWLSARIRYKPPGRGVARELEFALDAAAIDATFEAAPASFRFATAVAGFAEVLRKSPYAGSWKLEDVVRIAGAAEDAKTERRDFSALAIGALAAK